jgi:hypothetical protein
MMQTGLADAGMLWPEAAVTFKISEAGPYMLRADLGAVNTKTVTVNQDYWDNLPDEVKEVLQAVSIDYRDHLAGIAMDRAAWANAMPNNAQEWAATLNDNGEPGTEMLEAYLGKLEAAGFVGVRDWPQP